MEEVGYRRVIFITLVSIDSINDRNIYADLMRYFVNQGHHVTIISPTERRHKVKGRIEKFVDHTILTVNTLNNQKANIIEKGVATFSIDYLLKRAIKKHLSNEVYDLAIYSTPPITLTRTIRYLKKKYNLQTYLLLKDIFPQNAVDLGLMRKTSFFYKYFRSVEEKLYDLSDRIGCMSQANVDYVLSNNPSLDSNKVEICPNSLESKPDNHRNEGVIDMKKKLGVTNKQRVFIYGGNLGKPQGVDFLLEILNIFADNSNVYFIIIGSGTEYQKISKWQLQTIPKNVLVKAYVPKEEYDQYVRIADIGLIFLDYGFTIPNYPSRLLGYLESEKPILAFTDEVSDIGKNAEKRGYGIWCPSNDIVKAIGLINHVIQAPDAEIRRMGTAGKHYFTNNYLVEHTYRVIMKSS